MINNYFKTAIRSLLKNKSYTFINIIGLTVGIAACLCIFLVILFEVSFDTFHSKKDRIYRVVTEIKHPEGMDYTMGVPFPMPEALRLDFPQLEQVCAIFGTNISQVTIIDNDQPGKKFREERSVYFAESSFFN